MNLWQKLFGKREEPQSEVSAEPEVPGKFLVIQAGFEDDGKIRLEVEYDDVFVKSLRARGYVGVDDHSIVMRYVGDVYRTIVANNEIEGYD